MATFLSALAAVGRVLLAIINVYGRWRRDQEIRQQTEADAAAREAEAYRKTTQRMQDAEPDDTDTDAIRARLRNRPRGTR